MQVFRDCVLREDWELNEQLFNLYEETTHREPDFDIRGTAKIAQPSSHAAAVRRDVWSPRNAQGLAARRISGTHAKRKRANHVSPSAVDKRGVPSPHRRRASFAVLMVNLNNNHVTLAAGVLKRDARRSHRLRCATVRRTTQV